MSSEETLKASKTRYLECQLAIDTVDGWEKSVTKVLSSFQDISFDIDPLLGIAYVKGKIDPQIVLKKLQKGGKHAKIQRITYGPERDYYYDHHHQYQPYVSHPQYGHDYNYDPYNYNNYHANAYANYNPWHNNYNNVGHLLPNNPYQEPFPSRRRQRPSFDHFHHHGSPVSSSSLSSSLPPSSPPRQRVREPLVGNQRKSAKEKVKSIAKIANKFRTCFMFGVE